MIPGIENMTPAEKVKARLQLVLQAAARADEALKAKEKKEEEERRREEERNSLSEQVRRVKEIENIESDSFVAQAFRSSREAKTASGAEEAKHESPVSGTASADDEDKESKLGNFAIPIKYQDDNSLAHPNLFVDKAEAEERWYKRLVSLRLERLMGSPVA